MKRDNLKQLKTVLELSAHAKIISFYSQVCFHLMYSLNPPTDYIAILKEVAIFVVESFTSCW